MDFTRQERQQAAVKKNSPANFGDTFWMAKGAGYW